MQPVGNNFTTHSIPPAASTENPETTATNSQQAMTTTASARPSSPNAPGNHAPAWLAANLPARTGGTPPNDDSAAIDHAVPAHILPLFSLDALPHPLTIRLAHGTLEIKQSVPRDDVFVHTGIYRPHAPLSLAGSQFADFSPCQPSLMRDSLESFTNEFHQFGNTESAEPIDISTIEDGRLAVMDGHHRLAAAMALNLPIEVEIDPREEMDDMPSGKDWSHITVENRQ